MSSQVTNTSWRLRRVLVLASALILLASVLGFYLINVWVSWHPGSQWRRPISAEEYQKMLGVGINVNWMTFRWVKHYYFYWRSKGVSVPEYFREKGFSNVRIRVSDDVTKNKAALAELGEIVNDTLEAGLLPIIAYTAPELRETPTSVEAQKHFVKWWLVVARYFKGYPYTLSYDLIVESSGGLKNHPEVLNKVYSQAIAGIRAVDPYRIVFVTPAGTSSPFRINEINVTNSGFVLVEWHIYAGGPRGCSFNESLIRLAVSEAARWTRETGIPTWVGAWRPNVYPKACGRNCQPLCPMEVELSFIRAMVSALSSAGIPYDINADTKFFDIENLAWYRSQEEALKLILHPRS